jgi:hypothetical protein
LSLWGRRGLLVGELLVVLPALAGDAEPLDLPSAPLGDEVVLDAVTLLLATEEVPLPPGVAGTLDGELHAVDDELESLTLTEHPCKLTGLAGRQLLFMTERRVEERGEVVNPHSLACGWPITEEQALHRLDGVEPETDQHEDQLVRCARQASPAATATTSAAQPPGVPAIQSGLPSLLEGRKELPKAAALRPVSVLKSRGCFAILSCWIMGVSPLAVVPALCHDGSIPDRVYLRIGNYIVLYNTCHLQ